MSQNRKKYKEKKHYTVAEKERILKHRRYDERVEGENLYYFALHNMISGSLFLIITALSGIWEIRQTNILNLFTSEFIELVLVLFAIYLLTGITGRITAFFLMKYLLKANDKVMKKFWDANKGINKIGMVWLLSILLSSLIFAFGIIALLQNAIYDENTFFTLIGTYLIVRLIVYLFFKVISYFKF